MGSIIPLRIWTEQEMVLLFKLAELAVKEKARSGKNSSRNVVIDFPSNIAQQRNYAIKLFIHFFYRDNKIYMIICIGIIMTANCSKNRVAFSSQLFLLFWKDKPHKILNLKYWLSKNKEHLYTDIQSCSSILKSQVKFKINFIDQFKLEALLCIFTSDSFSMLEMFDANFLNIQNLGMKHQKSDTNQSINLVKIFYKNSTYNKNVIEKEAISLMRISHTLRIATIQTRRLCGKANKVVGFLASTRFFSNSITELVWSLPGLNSFCLTLSYTPCK
ncbi:hypothetical protein BpHYR1_043239 [Brachionus plicatilis]|uniref:Uncharacterized protein n=1 Tax=Brachionus plicatilis TaxID=10195 RepID=A0A3M7R3P6_BRAPC|nr:hypothetical protein BpHYR1_043239 [Brachionus plicatilis]